MIILVGDIGGTSTRLAAWEWHDGSVRELAREAYSSPAHAGLEELVEAFLRHTGLACERACFGLAGPVSGRGVRTTNLPWTVDAGALETRFGFARVTLINDLEATAWGVPTLGPDDLLTLNPGRPDSGGNRAVIAAGTGLGEAGLFWDGRLHWPFACEGGHATFAPATDEEWQLRQALARDHGHVSWERVVSGPGLAAIYRFLLARGSSSGEEAAVDPHDPAAIAEAGLSRVSPAAERALRMFSRLYGAEAGNLALKVMATGGVYLAGGIAPRIARALADGSFVEGLVAKGRMRPLLEAVPVWVVLSPDVALAGAARRAAHE